MKKTLLLILLTALPLSALSASCPQGVLDGKVHIGGNYGEEFFSCHQGKIYPKTLKYCAAENEDNKKWRGGRRLLQSVRL